MKAFSHKTETRVKWDETDCSGVIYLSNYCKWFDDAIVEFLRSRKITNPADGGLRVNGEPQEVTFVVGEYQCRIISPSRLDDLLEIYTRVEEIRSKTIIFKSELRDGKDGRLLATGSSTYVCIKHGDFKSINIPKNIVELIK